MFRLFLFAVHRMSGSQHVHEEPGFRHSLANRQVGKRFDQMYRPILIFVVVSSQQRMHQYRLRNGRIENGGQKAEGELKSYLTLVWMAPPPLPATIDWPELLALDY